jgi:AcrR family transcriptional regulator
MLSMPASDDDVLDAVARILERDGIRALTLSAVADEAEVSRVTLHRRGTTIDDLVVDVLARASDELRTELWPVVTDSGNAARRLDAGLRALCAVAERHSGVLAAFFAAPAWPLPERAGRTTSFEFIELFERLLRDGQLDGTLSTDDPTDDATLIANSVCWTYLHMRRAHAWSVAKATDGVVALATARLAPTDTAAQTG